MTDGFRDFEFDLPEALLASLVGVFDDMNAAPLDAGSIGQVPEAQGVYQLFLDRGLAYIGKTDGESGLRNRLARHLKKIQHRRGLDPSRVTFRAVRVYVFTAVDLESQLLSHYRDAPWNGSGFGSNDPGRERDTTKFKKGHFDSLFPIDIDLPLRDLSFTPGTTAAACFDRLRAVVPYTFRSQSKGGNSRKPHPDLETLVEVPPEAVMTTRSVIRAIVPRLPPGWQATLLPSHVILYKEHETYPSGEVLARS
jgi:hypothetical protein